jgi:hypothetical protein
MLIPTGMRYTAKHTASTVKFVHCALCGKDFVYLMQRSATGSGSSPLFLDNQGAKQRAAAAATNSLRSHLQTDFDAVPCVHCKQFQPEMAKRMRFRRHLWLPLVGIAIVVISAIVILIMQQPDPRPRAAPPPPLAPMLIYPAVGLAMIALYVALWISFDPNQLSDVRKAKLCKSPAMDRESFDARMAENTRAGFVSFDPSQLFLKRMSASALTGGATTAPQAAVPAPFVMPPRPTRRS